MWAYGILENCRARYIDVNDPLAIRASEIVGFETALRIFTSPGQDAMFRRVPGSFGCGKH
jgi:hypothetical protein